MKVTKEFSTKICKNCKEFKKAVREENYYICKKIKEKISSYDYCNCYKKRTDI